MERSHKGFTVSRNPAHNPAFGGEAVVHSTEFYSAEHNARTKHHNTPNIPSQRAAGNTASYLSIPMGANQMPNDEMIERGTDISNGNNQNPHKARNESTTLR